MIRERGLAAVTALLIVAVAASTAALMLSQQSAMLDQTAMVAARAQADAYGQAGLDWARGVLTADSKDVDSLNEGWAQPMAGLPVERAVVSGFIVDEQGKLNLNNLVRGNVKSEPDVAIFERLLESLGLPRELADAVVDWIDANGDLAGPGGAEDSFYLSLPRPYRAANAPMLQVEELYRVRGFDAKAITRLRPYVTALSQPGSAQQAAPTLINANTAGEALLAAVLPQVPREQLAAIVAARAKSPLGSKDAVMAAMKPVDVTGIVNSHLDVKSAFFQVTVQVTQDDAQVGADALLWRKPEGRTVMIWRRPRF